MSKTVHLNNAPIKEALIDIRVERRDGLSISDLDVVASRLHDEYPQSIRIEHNQVDLRINAGQDPTTRIDTTHHGYRLSSTDGRRLAQIQLDSFTFNWLEPYSTWEELSEQARAAWAIYAEVTNPSTVLRLGVRYINRIVLPYNARFEDYLTAPPTIPDALPQSVESFLSRIVIHDGNLDAQCILTQAMESSNPSHENLPITLDIDVIANKRFSLEDDFWRTIENLRDLKNRIFFESITGKTVELYR